MFQYMYSCLWKGTYPLGYVIHTEKSCQDLAKVSKKETLTVFFKILHLALHSTFEQGFYRTYSNTLNSKLKVKSKARVTLET